MSRNPALMAVSSTSKTNVKEDINSTSDEIGTMSDYFHERNSKLSHQFNERYTKKTDIFTKCSFYIDGYTEPSSDILQKLIVENGGRYVHYFSKTEVTHVICTMLCASKQVSWENVKVCTPNWIVSSVEQGVLLPWSDYKLSNGQNTAITKFTRHLKAGEDGFMQEFYNNSRLHHLSKWKSDFQKYVDKFQDNFEHQGLMKLVESLPFNESQKHPSDSKFILHIDMDCFFASVCLLKRPDLINEPVVVTHATGGQESSPHKNSTKKSYAEIASCNYIARRFGVKNGMLFKKGLELCPNLVALSYDFEAFNRVSYQLYDILLSYTNDVEAVSCDEAYVDCSSIMSQLPTEFTIEKFCERLRTEIFATTGCRVSCGVGGNKVVARLATKAAKPDGCLVVLDDESRRRLLDPLSVRDLPGVGRVMAKKLDDHGIVTCAQVRASDVALLQRILGPKTGQLVLNLARGEGSDDVKRTVERKSVSADVNYGMRYKEWSEVKGFVDDLCTEIIRRLKENTTPSTRPTKMIIKFMLKHPEAKSESKKFMGHGYVNIYTKSVPLSTNAGCSPVHLAELYLATLKRQVSIESGQNIADPTRIRGMGVTLTDWAGVKRTNVMEDMKNSTLPRLDTFLEAKKAKLDAPTTPSTRKSSLIQYESEESGDNRSSSRCSSRSVTFSPDVIDKEKKFEFNENNGTIIRWNDSMKVDDALIALETLNKQSCYIEMSEMVRLKSYVNKLLDEKEIENVYKVLSCLKTCVVKQSAANVDNETGLMTWRKMLKNLSCHVRSRLEQNL